MYGICYMETNLKKFNKKLLHFNINCVCWCLKKRAKVKYIFDRSEVGKLFQKKRALRSKKDVVDSLRPLKLLYNIKHFNGT